MKKMGRYYQEYDFLVNLAYPLSLCFCVPADLLVDEYQPGNRRMDFYSWLFSDWEAPLQ